MLHLESRSPDDTRRFAVAITPLIRGGDLLLLEGELGAGKTTFTRELALALGSRESVTSPTFVLQKLHHLSFGTVMKLVHYDVYRIHDYAELLDLGFEELLPDNVTVVEWGDKFGGLYPGDPIRISFAHAGDDERRISVSIDAERAGMLNAALQAEGLCQ